MGSDAVLHPRGPLPPAIYWRRRLVTLGAVVVLFALLWRACGSDGSPTAGVSPSPSPSSSAPSRSATPSRPATGAPSPTASNTPSPSPTPSPTLTGACRTADLTAGARADAQTYPAGRRPVLTITLTNKGRAPCTFDVGQANREIRVLSGNDRVWSSDDCSPGGSHDMQTIDGGKSVSFSVTWSRKRSAAGCPSGTPMAAAGTYRVVGRFGDILSAPDTFSLE